MKLKVIALPLCIALLGGCATAPRLTRIGSGSPVAIVATVNPRGNDTNAIHDRSVERGATSGAGAGAVTGALAGLTCGPLAVLCVPAAAAGGGIIGMLTGATVGLAGKLPKDKVTLLTDRLARLQQAHDPLLELRTNVADRASTHWELTEDTSKTVVSLELQNLFLTSTQTHQIALVMNVLVSVRTGTEGGKPPSQKRFEIVSPKNSLAVWLDERSDVPETSMRTACEQLAAQIVAELALR